MKLSLLPALLVTLFGLPLHAQDDPVDPGACVLQEVGRMNGWITKTKIAGRGQEFGFGLASVGDVNHDSLGDWVAAYQRCDTMLPHGSSYRMPLRLRLYYGNQAFPPDTASGEEIGPVELGADVKLLTSGDFDGDSNRDLVVSIYLYNDTSDGTFDYEPKRLVIYWGDGSGHFSNADTTQLENVRTLWVALSTVVVERWPNESADRLIVKGGYSWRNGEVIPSALLNLYIAPSGGGRWGRNNVVRTPVWTWWNASEASLRLVDHDGDGNKDLFYSRYEDGIGQQGECAVVYGMADGFFDTLAIEYVRFTAIEGKVPHLLDLTGDSIPELCVTQGDSLSGAQLSLLVYVGRRGQRLLAQYGTGREAPHPGDQEWWGRPWAEVWLPKRFNAQSRDISFSTPLLGNLGLDRIDDFTPLTYGAFIGYNGGIQLDSLIDGVVPIPGSAAGLATGARLGNIDGSGYNVIAVHFEQSPGGIAFFHPDSCVDRTRGEYRILPEGTGPSAVPRVALPGPPLEFTATPSPAHDNVVLRWSHRSGVVSIAALDMQGRTLQRWSLPASSGSLPLDLARWPRGNYLFSLTASGRHTATLPLLLH